MSDEASRIMGRPRYDLVGPYRGPCAFCGHDDARHRLYDAIADRLAAAEEPRALAADYGLSVRAIERVGDDREERRVRWAT